MTPDDAARWAANGRPPRPPDRQRIAVLVERFPHEPDLCTLFPADAPTYVLETTWFSARAGSYVDLGAMR